MKNKNFLPIVLSAVLFLIAVIFLLPCDSSRNFVCQGKYGESLGQPLALGSVSFFLISIILLFVKKEVFVLWSKFALVAIPLLVLWIILTPVTCGAALGVCLDKELVSWYASISFLIISLIIIIYKSLQIRSKIDLTK